MVARKQSRKFMQITDTSETKLHQIKPGDNMPVRQPEKNNFSLLYDRVQYAVEEIKRIHNYIHIVRMPKIEYKK